MPFPAITWTVPLSDLRSWEGFHGGWPMMIVAALGWRLPRRYIAEPQVHLGPTVEIDVATYEEDEPVPVATVERDDATAATVATEVWAPPTPTWAVATDLPDLDEYEVRVYDTRRGRRLVAAVEIVSPANKDRPEHRRALRRELPSTLLQGSYLRRDRRRRHDPNRDSLRRADGIPRPGRPFPGRCASFPLCGCSRRSARRNETWALETWAHPLTLGQPLPTLPLWLAEDFAIPLELDPSYEETCRVLRIP